MQEEARREGREGEAIGGEDGGAGGAEGAGGAGFCLFKANAVRRSRRRVYSKLTQ